VAVIIGALLIIYLEIYWIDPIVTIIIGLYILKETWEILKQTVDILMQGTPEGLDLELIRNDIERIPEVSNIHHVHAWNLDDQSVHYECHIDLNENYKLTETQAIHSKIEEILKDKYHISHLTIQFEFERCDDKKMIHN
jgi:cobalt-zinc-cadmium efflux system protein